MASQAPDTMVHDIAAALQRQLDSYSPTVEAVDVGRVSEVGDGIARVTGLTGVRASEMVQFENGTLGIAFNLEADQVGVIIMGEYTEIEEGQTVKATGRIVSVPVGDALIGRVVNAIGQPVDGKGPVLTDKSRNIERIAPGVVERENVNTPAQTGVIAIDSLTPIGRGQRELIIGDRQTGKTALAIDTIINQKGKNLLCIYVAIGQKRPRWRASSAPWKSTARWITPSSSSPRLRSRPRCNTSPRTPAARWAKNSWRPGARP